jgi:hypothetical protein
MWIRRQLLPPLELHEQGQVHHCSAIIHHLLDPCLCYCESNWRTPLYCWGSPYSTLQLLSTTIAIHVYVPPAWPGETYSQGFWHAVLAEILYFLGSMMLMVNMVGYFRGHYPQQFDLDDDQRTLILQTIMFFFWLAGGAAIFSKIEGWTYTDALYYADVVGNVSF